MKKHELLGLSFAILIIIVTYSINYFYDYLSDMVNPHIASAEVKIDKNNSGSNNGVFNPLIVRTTKEKYFRYELVGISVKYQDLSKQPIHTGTLTATIYKNRRIIKTVGDTREIILKYDAKTGLWNGKWPIPWNPPLGEYKLLVKAMPNYPGPVLTATTSFEVIAKNPPEREKGFCAMLVEYGGNVLKKNIIGPNDKKGTWHNILRWTKYIGADALFILGGETETYNSYVTHQTPFDPMKIKTVEKIAKFAKKEGLIFGAWIMSFGYQGKNCDKLGYKPSLAFNPQTGQLFPSYMHISIGDKKRFNDLLTLVKRFDKNPNIDFIGIDYIRTGHLDGYEVADEVVRDMNIPVPQNWDTMSSYQKAIWFATKVRIDNDDNIIEKWRWWRAHKVAEIVHNLIEYSGTKKPVWVFTLGWEHGKQHGQDPLMFTDAGVTYDAVMLYEANQNQFRQVLVDWEGYLSSKQANILVGESVDVTLLDSNYLTPPEEFVRRTSLGSKKITFGGMADGIFWHDFSRALWGRIGVYSSKEWFLTAGKVFSDFRLERGELEIKTMVSAPKKVYLNNLFNVTVTVENQSLSRIENIRTEIIKTPGIYPVESYINIPSLEPGEIRNINFRVQISFNSDKIRNSYMISSVSKWEP